MEFERHVRALLATGVSAEVCRAQVLMNARFFLGERYSVGMEIPNARWFRQQREGAGAETTLMQWVRIARCNAVIQLGYDETKIDGIPTFNQWCLIEEERNLAVVVVECGGTLTGSKAKEIAEHVRVTWERGHNMVLALREVLEGSADRLCPMKDGGVMMHKIGSTMHDSCNLANALPPLLKAMVESSGKAHFGEEGWAGREEKRKIWLDYLCGNHTRNLPIDAFNRLFDKYLKSLLGDHFTAAIAASGGKARLETDGRQLLRAIAKLVHVGHGAYEKGDGLDFSEFLSRKYPGITNKLVGRVELASRQDWQLEASAKAFPLLPAIIEFTIECLELDPNMLRDSVLQRLELLHMEAYIHVNAIMWESCFRELRLEQISLIVFNKVPVFIIRH